MTRMNYGHRLALLKERMAASGLGYLLVTNETNVSYLSGFTGADSMILIGRKKAFFITDSRYKQDAEESTKGFEIEISGHSAFETIKDILKNRRAKKIGFEASDITYSTAARLRSLLRGIEAEPTTGLVEGLRAIKDSSEITAVKRSIALTRTVFKKALRILRPGLTEESLARHIDIEYLKNGARSAFDTIVAAGANSSKPHAIPTRTRLRNDSFVMIDTGCRLNGYCSDMTRTVLTGKIKDRFARIYSIVRQAQERAINKVRDGVNASEVDFAARGYIHRMGFGKYFGHSVGHGVGMQIHEEPNVSRSNRSVLRSGMIVTIEPAIYLPGFGGVRIEDMVLVTDKGCDILTR